MKYKVGDIILVKENHHWAKYKILSKTEAKLIDQSDDAWVDWIPKENSWDKEIKSCINHGQEIKKLNFYKTKLGKILYK